MSDNEQWRLLWRLLFWFNKLSRSVHSKWLKQLLIGPFLKNFTVFILSCSSKNFFNFYCIWCRLKMTAIFVLRHAEFSHLWTSTICHGWVVLSLSNKLYCFQYILTYNLKPCLLTFVHLLCLWSLYSKLSIKNQ